jgi:hypothetical protein
MPHSEAARRNLGACRPRLVRPSGSQAVARGQNVYSFILQVSPTLREGTVHSYSKRPGSSHNGIPSALKPEEYTTLL